MNYTVAYGGERLDRIAVKMLQTERQGAVEALLEANPGLASILVNFQVPAGTVIAYPADFTATPSQTFVLAWE